MVTLHFAVSFFSVSIYIFNMQYYVHCLTLTLIPQYSACTLLVVTQLVQLYIINATGTVKYSVK